MITRPSTPLVGLLVVVFTLAACAAGAAPSPSPAPPTDGPPSTIAPDDPVTGDPGGIFPNPPGGPVDLVPKPGQRDPRPVNIDAIEVRTNGARVAARVSWTSGVEPCYAFDSVLVKAEGQTVTITVLEGSGPGDTVCIEIAQLKSTIVDLGEFPPGTYTIQASQGVAEPVTVTIS